MPTKWERLQDVYDSIEEDDSWSYLRGPGIRLVRGDGRSTAETARVMVIGQNPGAQENGAGIPFIGASGRVLNDLLNRAGLHRTDVFITNLVKYKTPNNRSLTEGEVYAGQGEVRREWSIIMPRLTIAVGASAHMALGPAGLMFSQTPKGHLFMFGSRSWMTSQYHPAFGLRNKQMQPKMERDWDFLGEVMRDVGGILCSECKGESAREGIPCNTCHPEE